MSKRGRSSRSSLFFRLLAGPALLLVASGLLWSNEGRQNLAEVARKSLIVNPAEVEPQADGRLVSLTGPVAGSQPVGDGQFLRPGDYVLLQRTVEMYAWVEEEESDEDSTSYSYSQEWTNDPRPASEFQRPEGHDNPPPPEFASATYGPETAYLGRYNFDPLAIDMPGPDRLALTPRLAFEGPYQVGDEYLFLGEGRVDEPQLGDVRVSFAVLPAGMQATVLARAEGARLVPYDAGKGDTLFRLFRGDHQAAVDRLQFEYKAALWGLRFLGLILNWIGVAMLFSPINRLFRLVPLLGQVSRWATAALSLAIALPLTVIIVSVAFLAHNIWALLLVLLLLGAGIYLWRREHAPTSLPTPPPA